MADGTIRVETKIDTDEAKADLEKMQKMCDETKKHVEQITENLGFKVKPVQIISNSELNKAKRRLDEIAAEIADIQAQTDKELSLAATDEQAVNLLEMEKYLTQDLAAEQDALNQAVSKYEQMQAEINAEKQKQKKPTADAKKETDALTDSTKKYKKESADAFNSAKKHADGMGNSIKKAIGTMAKYTLAIFGARSAFYAVKSAIRQAVSENEQLNNTVTAMKGLLASALAPAVERVVYYIQYGLAYLNLFIKTLTGVDLVANYNAKALKKQAEATKQAGKAAKEAKNQLASFDEKNMLGSTNNSASADTTAIENAAKTLDLPDVSGGKFEKICQSIKAHLEEIELAAGLLLLGTGMILLACGQIPLGIAAIIAGITLAAIALKGWGGLSNETKRMLSTIMGIAGGAFLALGLILAISGVALPLGIALIAFGAGLLIADAVLNWNSTDSKVRTFMDNLKRYLLGGFEIVLGIILCCTGVGVPLGVSLIKQGVKTITSEEPVNAQTIKATIKNVMEDMKKYLVGGLEIVFGVLLCCTGVGIPLGIKLIKDGWSVLKGETPVDESAAAKIVQKMFEKVKSYWNSHVAKIFTRQYWSQKLQALPDGAKLAINVVLQTIENALNWITNGLNRIQFNVPDWVPGIGGYRMGFNFSPVRLPRLQYGGVVNAPGRGQALIAGEAGAEAILPLTNNTEWMDILADKVIDKMSKVPIINKFIVNDKTVFAEYKKSQAAFNFATNGGVL